MGKSLFKENDMRKAIATLLAFFTATFASVAYAQCTTQTYIMPSGKMMVCTTCCNYGNCTTTCT